MLKDNEDILKAVFPEDTFKEHAIVLLYISISCILVLYIYRFMKRYFSKTVMDDLEDRAEAMVSSYHRMKDDSFEDMGRTKIEMGSIESS